MHLLVGFVNQFYTPKLCLGLLDPQSERFTWVMDEKFMRLTSGVRGVNGLIRLGDRIVVGYQSDPTLIAVLDSRLQIAAHVEVPRLKDTHSFAPLNGELLAASSRTDEIYALRFDESFNLLQTTLWWRHPDNVSAGDEHHVNSVAVHNGAVLASCLGQKQPGGWSQTVNGQLFNISHGTTLLEGVHHPHTAYSLDGRWLLCESGTGCLIAEDGSKTYIGGYLRGLAHDDEHLYVAASGRRLISRSEGTLNLAPTATLHEAKSAIHVLKRNTFQLVKTVDLGFFGTEIYDLAVVDFNSLPEFMSETDPLELKIRHLEMRVMELESNVQRYAARTFRGLLRATRRRLAAWTGRG